MPTRVQRIWGPPGTGKTTTLAKRTSSTVRERGPDALRICSFSTTAAAEIASRPEVKGALADHAIGTLHSHAFRAIGMARGEWPAVALDPKIVGGWNSSHGAPWQITGDTRGLSSRDRAGAGFGGLDTGDALLEQLDLLRASQTPGPQWPVPVRAFTKAWTEWKREVGAVDFTDMIVEAYRLARDGVPMPGNPSVLVVDEAQDMTPIEAALTLEWGRHLGEDGRLVFALDDDQAIMEWRGGDPRIILGAEVDDDEVLARSHRVPPAVHAVAQAWISRIGTRYPKEYQPRVPGERDITDAHARGWAFRVGMTLSDPRLVDQIERDLADPDQPDATVMVLASCGYMLHPLIKTLRTRGIPFHNPFRPADGSWNPLAPPGRGVGTPERIYRYLVLDERELGAAARKWTADDIRAWRALVSVKAACLARGSTRLIDALPSGEVGWDHLSALFAPGEGGDEALRRATCGDDDPRDHLEWLASVVSPSLAQRTAYPLQVARSQGAAALTEQPRLVLGTIHSVKGATADRVYVAPDLSGAGMRQWQQSQSGRDQIIRLFYVAATRAYHRLAVLLPTSTSAISPTELIPPDLEIRR